MEVAKKNSIPTKWRRTYLMQVLCFAFILSWLVNLWNGGDGGEGEIRIQRIKSQSLQKGIEQMYCESNSSRSLIKMPYHSMFCVKIVIKGLKPMIFPLLVSLIRCVFFSCFLSCLFFIRLIWSHTHFKRFAKKVLLLRVLHALHCFASRITITAAVTFAACRQNENTRKKTQSHKQTHRFFEFHVHYIC